MTIRELNKKYYVLATTDHVLGKNHDELGECLLAWRKEQCAKLYLDEVLPLSDIKTIFSIKKVRFGDLFIEAVESGSDIIIDELPDDSLLEHIAIKDYVNNYPLEINAIKFSMGF